MLKRFGLGGWKDGRILIGEKVGLRPMGRGDHKKIRKWLQDKEVVQLAFGVVADDEVLDKIASDYLNEVFCSSNNCMCIDSRDGKSVGFVRFSIREEVVVLAKIGIVIGEKDVWNRGYGQEAIGLLLRCLFEQRNVSRVELDTAKFNLRAQRCFEKCGFKKVGEVTEINFLDGNFSHKVWMNMDREDFMKMSQIACVAGERM